MNRLTKVICILGLIMFQVANSQELHLKAMWTFSPIGELNSQVTHFSIQDIGTGDFVKKEIPANLREIEFIIPADSRTVYEFVMYSYRVNNRGTEIPSFPSAVAEWIDEVGLADTLRPDSPVFRITEGYKTFGTIDFSFDDRRWHYFTLVMRSLCFAFSIFIPT